MNEYKDIEPSKPEINWPKNLRDEIPRERPVLKKIEYQPLIDELEESDNSITIWDILKVLISQPFRTLQIILLIIKFIIGGRSMFTSIFKNWRTSLSGLLIALTVWFGDMLKTGQWPDLWTTVLSVGIMAVGFFLPDMAFIKSLLQQLLDEHQKKQKTGK